MSDYIDRMKKEHNELKERLEKLNAFTVTDKFKELNDIEQRAMIEQAVYMDGYLKTLHGRLWRAHGNS